MTENISVDGQSPEKKSFLQGRRKYIIIGAIAVLVVALVVAGFAISNAFAGVSREQVESDLRDSSSFMEGIASDDYVNPSEYGLSDVKILSTSDNSDNTKTIVCSAVLENENFRSEVEVTSTYIRVKDLREQSGFLSGFVVPTGKSDSDWVVLTSHTEGKTTALKGIDFDTKYELTNLSPDFDELAQTCSVTSKSEMSEWFVETQNTTIYEYLFDGTSWKLDNVPEEKRVVTYKDIEGPYQTKADMQDLVSFNISSLDPTKGTFTITYELTRTTSGETTTITGSLEAVIDPVASSWTSGETVMSDGYTYRFVASGTSSSGNGEAKLEGTFVKATTGEAKVDISKFHFDYSYTFLNSTQSTTSTLHGSLYKQ